MQNKNCEIDTQNKKKLTQTHTYTQANTHTLNNINTKLL